MQRRTLIKQLAFATGASFLMPACLQNKTPVTKLKHISINFSQEALLAALSATIIPTTETIGATEISAHVFALNMIDDCYKKEDQDLFISGLKAFEKMVSEKFNGQFASLKISDKALIINELEHSKNSKTPIIFFLHNYQKINNTSLHNFKILLNQSASVRVSAWPF